MAVVAALPELPSALLAVAFFARFFQSTTQELSVKRLLFRACCVSRGCASRKNKSQVASRKSQAYRHCLLLVHHNVSHKPTPSCRGTRRRQHTTHTQQQQQQHQQQQQTITLRANREPPRARGVAWKARSVAATVWASVTAPVPVPVPVGDWGAGRRRRRRGGSPARTSSRRRLPRPPW